MCYATGVATEADRIVALERLLERRAQNYDKHMDRMNREIRRLKAQLAAERAKNSDEPIKVVNLICPTCMTMLDGRGV